MFFFGAGSRLARYIRNEPVRHTVRLATQDFGCGSHLLLFPEGTRTVSCPINPFKGSIGLISNHAQVPVQTVLIETEFAVSEQRTGRCSANRPMPIHYRMRLGRRFDPPQDARRFTVELEQYFAHELLQGSAFYPTNSLPAQAVNPAS